MSIDERARVLWWILQKTQTVAKAAGEYDVCQDAAPSTAPAGSVVVIYSLQVGQDRQNASALRLWNDSMYIVKTTGPATLWDTVVAVADAVDNALQLKGEEVTGPSNDVMIMRCDRERPIPLPTPAINGVTQATLASLWRVHARSLVG